MTTIQFLEPNPKITGRRDAIIEGLFNLLPDECVITNQRELKPFETDAFTAYRRVPLAVVLPYTTEQVADVLKYCSTNNVPVVPRGAGTSLAGGAIPQEDAIVIGVSRMTRMLEVDYDNRTAIVEAGRNEFVDIRCCIQRWFLLRSRSILAASLFNRRQYRHEFGRRPLPEIWSDNQQFAGREACDV